MVQTEVLLSFRQMRGLDKHPHDEDLGNIHESNQEHSCNRRGISSVQIYTVQYNT